MNSEKKTFNPLAFIVLLSAFLIGSVYSAIVYLITVLVLAMLLYMVKGNGDLKVSFSRVSVYGLAVLASGGVAWISGVDRGLGFFGFSRLICAGIFVLYQMQFSKEEKWAAVGYMPAAAIAMILLCVLFYPFESLRSFVINNGRAGGLFQYSNTFALYILLSICIFLFGESRKGDNRQWKCYLELFVLTAGLFWTGSRTTFILWVFVCLYFVILHKNTRRLLCVVSGVTLVLALIYVLVTGNVMSVGRFLTVSLQESTFLGRLLYWKDAFPLILKEPFGLGYGGYYELQPLIQTGVYTTKYVHNSFMQIALDYGVIALVSFLLIFLHGMLKANGQERILLAVIGLHAFFDIDLEYYAIVLLLIMLVDWNVSDRNSKIKAGILYAVIPCVMGIFLWLGVALGLDLVGMPRYAQKLYPWSSQINEELLISEENRDSAFAMAQRIMSENPNSIPASRFLALWYFDEKEYLEMLGILDHYLELSKYDMSAYSAYIHMIDSAVMELEEKGEDTSRFCSAISGVIDIIGKVKEQTSGLAYRIKDKPNFEIAREDYELIMYYKLNR